MSASFPNSEGEDIILSPTTLAALNEFLFNQQNERDEGLSENWQLSQFWYTPETCQQLVSECFGALKGRGCVACVSCPSLISHFINSNEVKEGNIEVRLFEFDHRFEQKYSDIFTYYDYNNPCKIPREFYNYFDFIFADPPFLSDECLIKIAQTIRLLSKPDGCKLLINTGTVMEELLDRVLSVKRTNFKPLHTSNLGNEFSTFTNYTMSTL